MKAILKKYNIIEKLLLFSFLILVSKPIVGQLLYQDNLTSTVKYKNNTPDTYMKSLKSSDLGNTEYIEEVEELSEDDETVHHNCSEKSPFYLPINKIVDKITIYSFQCSFYKTFSKPRYYITYSCLKCHMA